MKAEKQRLDVLLVERGLCESREKAKAVILSGGVLVDGERADKPGTEIALSSAIEIKGDACRYVSRGGLKLEKAVESFGLSFAGQVCMDIGASTGGFTDCMLQNSAVKVYAVDVGYGQLAWKLRTDERVVNFERTNIRYITKEQIPEEIDFFSVDVSFISLALVLPVAKELLKQGGFGVCLIKPQFEAGREKVGKKGVVRDPSVHEEVIIRIVNFCKEIHLSPLALDFSPIKGPQGNIEYLLLVQKEPKGSAVDGEEIEKTVRTAHENLSRSGESE